MSACATPQFLDEPSTVNLVIVSNASWGQEVIVRRKPIRKEKKSSPTATLDSNNWYKVLRQDPCAFCHAPADSLDHIHPKSCGGPTDTNNLIGACKLCNNERRSRSLLFYMLSCQSRDDNGRITEWYNELETYRPDYSSAEPRDKDETADTSA